MKYLIILLIAFCFACTPKVYKHTCVYKKHYSIVVGDTVVEDQYGNVYEYQKLKK